MATKTAKKIKKMKQRQERIRLQRALNKSQKTTNTPSAKITNLLNEAMEAVSLYSDLRIKIAEQVAGAEKLASASQEKRIAKILATSKSIQNEIEDNREKVSVLMTASAKVEDAKSVTAKLTIASTEVLPALLEVQQTLSSIAITIASINDTVSSESEDLEKTHVDELVTTDASIDFESVPEEKDTVAAEVTEEQEDPMTGRTGDVEIEVDDTAVEELTSPVETPIASVISEPAVTTVEDK